MADYYVKPIIESGDGSGETLSIIPNTKAAQITEYTNNGTAFPRSTAKYSHATQAFVVMSLDYVYVGSDTKIIEIDNMEFLIVGDRDAGASAVHYTFMLELIRCNFTSAVDIGSGSAAYSPIVPFDSADASSTLSVKFAPSGITNQEVLFSGYFHSSVFTVNPLLYQNKMSIPFGREVGKPITISGSSQALIPVFTPVAGGDRNFLLGSIHTIWHEY